MKRELDCASIDLHSKLLGLIYHTHSSSLLSFFSHGRKINLIGYTIIPSMCKSHLYQVKFLKLSIVEVTGVATHTNAWPRASPYQKGSHSRFNQRQE